MLPADQGADAAGRRVDGAQTLDVAAPQISRSVYVGTSLRWWLSSLPSGPIVMRLL
jgi:hypothetical protein